MEFVGLSIKVILATGRHVFGIVKRVNGTVLELDNRGQIVKIDGSEIVDLQIQEEHPDNYSDYKRSVSNGNISKKGKKKSTFSVPIDEMDQDFDFTASLELFDKKAIFNEIRESDSTAPESRLVSHNKRDPQRKLKNNENVLDSNPMNEFSLKSKTVFSTLGGMNVASIDSSKKSALENMAIEIGLFEEIMIENGGRSLATLILQAVGGNQRIKAGSSFDPPYVLILVGDHKSGAISLAGARHLLNHGCRVDCLIPKDSQYLSFQQKLVLNCQGRIFHDLSQLPQVSFEPIDFLVDSMAGSKFDKDLINWANSQRAPILSLEIPFGFEIHLGIHSDYIHAKYVVAFTLPLVSLERLDNAEIFLGDCGIPWFLYKKVLNENIENLFGDKYIVGLIKN